MFYVFIDEPVTMLQLACISCDNAYDASAVANAAVDAGYLVYHDVFNDQNVDQYAMLRPEVWEKVKHLL